MTLQIRPDQRGGPNPGESLFYCPARDAAYNFPAMFEAVCASVDEPEHDIIRALIAGHEPHEFADTARAVAEFINNVHDERSFHKCLLNSGLLKCDRDILGIMATRYLLIMMAMFHKGYGEVTYHGKEPPMDLAKYAQDCLQLLRTWSWMNIRWWERPIVWVRRWLRRRRDARSGRKLRDQDGQQA